MVGIQWRRLAGDFLAGHPLRLLEGPRRQFGADRRLAVDHGRIVLGLGVADANALLDERVVLFGELLDLLLAPLELAREPEPLATDGGPSLCCQITIRLLAGTNDRLANPHFELGEEPLAGAGVEVVGPPQLLLQLLELVASEVGVGREELAGGTDPNGGVLLLELGTHSAGAIELGQFVIAARRGRCGKGRPGNLLDATGLPPGDFPDEGRILIVGVAPEGCLGQPQRRGLGARRLGLRRKGGERLSLATDQVAGHDQPLTADDREKQSLAAACIAGQLGEIGVFRLRGGRWYAERHGANRGVVAERDCERGIRQRPLDQHDRFAVAAQRWHASGQHPQGGVHRLAGELDIAGPHDLLHSEAA